MHTIQDAALYPNPVTGKELKVQSSGKIESITLYNLLGEKVLEQLAVNNNQLMLNVGVLPKGRILCKNAQCWGRKDLQGGCTVKNVFIFIMNKARH